MSGLPKRGCPVVIRASAARSPASKRIPRNENVSLPAVAGTFHVPRLRPSAASSSSLVGPATSTSLKTAPKPLVSATTFVFGTTNVVSVTLEPIGANSRSAENGANASL